VRDGAGVNQVDNDVLSGLTRVGTELNRIGFDVGSYRISIYSALTIAAVIAAVIVAARIGTWLSRRFFARIRRFDATQRLLGEKLASIVIWLLVTLIGIDILGIDLTALAVFSGAFGLAVGFGLQKTFGNLIAGIILLMDRSIKPGDVISVNDGITSTFGQVNRIGIRAVSVITRDRKEYLIPNENLMINQVENWSYSSREVRVRLPVGVAYGCDIELAEQLMLQAARDSARVLDEPPPSVWLLGYGESSVNFEMRIWIDDPEAGIASVRSDVLKRLWLLFKENGVEIPFPQRDVNLRDSPALRAVIEALRDRDGAAE
jgi:small-conductance mechanosensitive channel